ncbi:MAG TPA: hypothetical protein GX743_02135 [Actinomycetales bacterium]|nr:hypothetical protein [Actinomycetales bacterium]
MRRLPVVVATAVLALAACTPDSPPEAPTTAPPVTASPTEEAPPTELPTEPSSEPTTEPEPSPEPTEAPPPEKAWSDTLPTLNFPDGEPVPGMDVVDATGLRTGVEGEGYQILAYAIDPQDPSGLQVLGVTCDGEVLAAHPLGSTVALGPIVPDADAPSGYTVDGREISLPDTRVGMNNWGFAAAPDGTVAWIHNNPDGDEWSLLAAGPQDSAARVLADSATAGLAEFSFPLAPLVDAENAYLPTCDGSGVGPCGGMLKVPLAGGELTDLGDNFWLPGMGLAGITHLDSPLRGVERTLEGEWVLRILIPEPEVSGPAVVLGEGPGANWAPEVDAHMEEGSILAGAIGLTNVEDLTGAAILVEGGEARAWTFETTVTDVQLTENYLVVGAGDAGLLVVPRGGGEPWWIELGGSPQSNNTSLFTGTACHDTVAVWTTGHSEDGVPGTLVLDLAP